jgi:fibronectin-binding autotransporter adhesin
MRSSHPSRIATFAASCALLTVFFIASSANAATFTWNGGGGSDTHVTLAANWAGGTAPSGFGSNSTTDDLIFGGTYASTTITLPAGTGTSAVNPRVRSITFDANAPAYTIVDDWTGGLAGLYTRSGATAKNDPNLPADTFLTNASSNQQILNCSMLFRMFPTITPTPSYGYIGVNLNNAIMSGGSEIPNLKITGNLGLYFAAGSTTSIMKVNGQGDLQVDGHIAMSVFSSDDAWFDTNTLVNVNGGLAAFNNEPTTVFRKMGTGTVIFNGVSPTAGMVDPGNTVYTNFTERVNIGHTDSNLTALTDMGAIRLTNAGAFGVAGTASASYTVIRGGNFSNGRLELANNIALGEYIYLSGRLGANSLNPALVNYSGNNSVDGAQMSTTEAAGHYNFKSNNAGEKLTVLNDFNVVTVGHTSVNFMGAGDCEFVGSIKTTDTAGSVSIGKYDSGTLTLSGYVNDRIGHILLRNGSLKLGAYSTFNFSPVARGLATDGTSITLPSTIHIDSGKTLDASAIAGGFNVNAVLQGSGSVLGTVVASNAGGLKVKPGDLAVMHAVEQASVTRFEAAAGTLTLGGLDMSTYVSGANPEFVWDLAALSTSSTDFDLLSVTGNLALGGASSLNLNFSLLPAALRPSAPTPNSFWLGNHSWKIIDAATNTGDTNFTNYLNPLGTAGQFSTSVGTGADAGDIFLNYTLIPYDVLTWVGGADSDAWNNNTSANWSNGGVSSKFTVLDQVHFTNSGNGSVNITEDVTPGYVEFNNSTREYTVTGPGAILGSTGLVKEGSGRVILANYGVNAFLGPIAVNNGILQVGNGGAAGNLGTGDITLAAGGTLTFNHNDDIILANLLLGTGNLRQEGSGTLTLSGANAGYSGTITVAAGILKPTAAAALGNATGGITINGGSLDVNGLNLGDEPVTVQGTGVGDQGAIVNSGALQYDALKYVTLSNDATFGGTNRWDIRGSGTFTANGHNLTKVGMNTIDIASNVDNLGAINVREGILYFEDIGTLGDPSKTVTIDPLATLAFHNLTTPANKVLVAEGGIVRSNRGNNTFAGPMTLNAAKIEVPQNTFTITGTMAGTGFEKTGAGNLVIASNNDSFVGSVTLSEGTLWIGSDPTGSLGSATIVSNTNTIIYFNRNNAFTPASVISGSGTVTYYDRDGVITLDHDNTYTGDTTIYQGTVILKSDKGLGSDGTTPATTGIRSGSDNARNGRLVLNPDTGVNLTIDENFTTSGAGGMPMNYNGPGLIDNLTGNNMIKGTITTRTDGGSTLITVSGGTLDLNGNITNTSSRRAIIFGGSGNGTVSGAIVDSSVIDVEKAGTGTWTLTNASNTYTGTTTVWNGTLAYSGSGNSNASSALILRSSTASIDMSLVSGQTLSLYKPLIGAGTITGSVAAASSVSAISPSGGAALPVNLPAGTMHITGGLTLGSSETLQFKLGAQNDKIEVAGDLNMNYGLSNVSIIPNGTLVAGDYTLLSAASASNTGTYTLLQSNSRYNMSLVTTNPAQLVLHVEGANANLMWNGGTAGSWLVGGQVGVDPQNWLNGGASDYYYQGDAVTFGTTADTAATTVTLGAIVAPASITVDSAQNYTIGGAGKITSGAGIVKQGDGTLLVSNSGGNDFTGGVTILGGTYRLGSVNALGSIWNGSLTINGGTLDLNGQAVRYRSNVNLHGAIVNNGAALDGAGESMFGAVTLTGDSTFGGSGNWSLDTQAYNIFSTPYLHGEGFALTKTGANTVSLRNMGNTGFGNVNINQGALSLSGNTTLGPSGTLTISDGASLILSNSVEQAKDVATGGTGGIVSLTAGNATLSGDATLTSPLTALSAAGTTLTLSGALAGAGNLTKNQPGTLILSGGKNGYTGNLIVAAGILELSNSSLIPNSDIVNEAALRVNGGTHSVDVISQTGASGTTSVLAGATLTATSITQTMLSIGTPPGGAASAIPEPSAWLLLAMGLIGALGLRRCRGKD